MKLRVMFVRTVDSLSTLEKQMTEWSDIKYFTEDEFKCSHCGECKIDLDFVKELDDIREKLNAPLRVNSGYRCPDHPIEAAKSEPGPHTTGRAADIGVSGDLARDFLSQAAKTFPGVGVNQTGDWEDRFIHVDQLGYRVWSY